MASFSEEASAYVLEAGKYIIRVGNCSRDTHVCGIVSLDQDAVTEKVKHICPGWGFEDMKPEGATYSYEGEAEEIAAALIIELDASRIETRVALYSEVMPEREKTEPFDFAKVVSRDKTLDEFVAGLTDEAAGLSVHRSLQGVRRRSLIGYRRRGITRWRGLPARPAAV